MHISELPERTQDYLKLLWTHEEKEGANTAMSLGDLAKAAGQKLPTTSEAVKRLAAKGLVEHERYFGVRLVEEGRRLAVAMVRRHRLLETFLVRTLGYTWDEVHDEAEMLEHATSDRLVERLDSFLGNPARDPHGDPIPAPDGTAEPVSRITLIDVPAQTPVTVEQVTDADGEFLRYLDKYGVRPGVELTVVAPSVAGVLEVAVDGGSHFPLGESAARGIAVRSISEAED